MKRLTLKELEISLPKIEVLEARTLFGGSGGYSCPDVVVWGERGDHDEEHGDPEAEPGRGPSVGQEYDDREFGEGQGSWWNGLTWWMGLNGGGPNSSYADFVSKIGNPNDLSKFPTTSAQGGALGTCVFENIALTLQHFGLAGADVNSVMDKLYISPIEKLNAAINGLGVTETTDALSHFFTTNYITNTQGLESAISTNNPVFAYVANGSEGHAVTVVGVNDDGSLKCYDSLQGGFTNEYSFADLNGMTELSELSPEVERDAREELNAREQEEIERDERENGTYWDRAP